MAKAKSKTPAKKTDPVLSPEAFGAKVGVSKQRILEAIKAGLLSESVRTGKKGERTVYLIDEGAGVKEWADNIDPSKQRDPDKQKATKELVTDSNFKKAKAAKEFYGAKLAELDYNERAGKLVSADRVKAESFKIGRRVRDSLLGVPERVAAELATMDDPRAISIYLKEQLAAALKDLGDLNNVSTRRA